MKNWLRAITALLGLLSVAPVLAWSFRLGTFRSWFLATTVPSVLGLLAVALTAARKHEWLRHAMAAGAIGGLLGTIGYDVFRIPFAAAGLRVFGPIDSYGVMLLGAHESSHLTSFAGWAYHFSNGVGFGIAYAVFMMRRNRWWAVGWGLLLETATIVTPFAVVYGLWGKWHLIALAYAAHVAYGYPLGAVVERGLPETAGRGAWTSVGAVVVVLALWLQPWSTPGNIRRGKEVAAGPSAVIEGGRFYPEWLRVRRGGCVTIRNADATEYTLKGTQPPVTVAPGQTAQACFGKFGAHRVRTSTKPYSGGWVIVDE